VSDRLTVAIRDGNLEEVRAQIKTAQEAEARSHHGMTALEFAIEHMQLDVIRYLLRIGADTNGRDENGVTPLHFAIDMECESARYDEDTEGADYAPKATVTRILLDEGADPSIASAGLMPLDLARRRNHAEASALIEAAIDRRRRSLLR
jgi:ankyrin repeat protein